MPIGSTFSNIRNIVSIISSILSLLTSALDVSVLSHLIFKQRQRGYLYLLILGITSLFGQFFFALLLLYDINLLPRTYAFSVYRAYVAMWLLNTFFVGNTYLLVALCFDRFVNLHYPVFYRTFTQKRYRLTIVAVCLLIGTLINAEYADYYRILAIKSNGTNSGGFSIYDIRENTNYTLTTLYIGGNIAAIVFCYYVPALVMLLFMACNAFKLHKIKIFFLRCDSGIRMHGERKKARLQDHVMHNRIAWALVGIFLVSVPLFSVHDFMFSEGHGTSVWYTVLIMLNDVIQALSLQANLFLFSFLSKQYRRTLVQVLTCKLRSISDKNTRVLIGTQDLNPVIAISRSMSVQEFVSTCPVDNRRITH